jgi:hypothetical protein
VFKSLQLQPWLAAILPQHHTIITPKGSGPVIGFWILSGVLAATLCCRIWLGPHIHFILIPDPLYTYRKCLKAFKHGWQWYCHITIPSLQKGVGWVVGFWVGFSLGTCSRIWLGLPSTSFHTRLTSYLQKVFKSLQLWMAVIFATSPYHTIAPKGVGWVVGFWMNSHWLGHAVGYDWDWDLPSPAYSCQIHFIHKAFDILYKWWAVIWLCPYSTFITIALAKKFGGERWECRFLTCIILLCNDRVFSST